MRLAQQRLEALYADHTLPLVFGHRGAMAYAPMNTLAAFELAAQQGAHGIELDVWLSADDALVVIHDFEVNHTTNGEGRVGSMSLAEIKALDAGSWFSPEFAGTQIPTLDEVFETVGKKVFVNVEIKSVSMDNQTIVQR
ncbi:MAG: glycerophosphodiester phosphodiesterase, partial [Phototrophicaceae bacterium]